MTIDEIKQKVEDENFTFKDFEEYYKKLKKEFLEFQKILEDASIVTKNSQIDFKNLLREITGLNSSDLIEKMKKLGYAIGKTNNNDQSYNYIQEAISGMSYKILELARAGKREDVFYTLLRIFVANKEKFPSNLVEVFKPIYSDELFKTFIFSFLSGILSKEEETSNKEN